MARTGTTDVVGAHLVLVTARQGLPVITGDTDALARLAGGIDPSPRIIPWPIRKLMGTAG